MKVRLTAVVIGILSLAALTMGLSNPRTFVLDESAYVGSARTFLHHAPNNNPEHPPLAKYLIAAGIKVLGDNQWGWRTPSAVAGSVSLVAMFLLTYLLSNDYSLALSGTLLTFLNGFHFVMARVAMLDVFLVMFTLWAVTMFVAAMRMEIGPVRRRSYMIASGVLFGLASACKWNAVVSLAVVVAICAALWLMKGRARLSETSSKSIGEIGVPVLAMSLVVLPVLVYSLTYWPLCRSLGRPFSFTEVKAMNLFIWNFHRYTTVGNVALNSHWYSWLLRTTPERGLSYLMGNLVVMSTGIMAVILLLSRARQLGFVEWTALMLYLSNILQWAITPRPYMYYYYYYPAATFLGVVLIVALNRAPRTLFGVRLTLIIPLAAGVFFLYCLPKMANLGAPWDTAFGALSLY